MYPVTEKTLLKVEAPNVSEHDLDALFRVAYLLLPITPPSAAKLWRAAIFAKCLERATSFTSSNDVTVLLEGFTTAISLEEDVVANTICQKLCKVASTVSCVHVFNTH